MSDSLVIIPTYNEKENIKEVIHQVVSLDKKFDILIVDDNSPDGTSGLVKEIQKAHNCVYLEVRPQKLGLGTAYIHGFQWALKKGYEYIIEMDADLSHNPQDLPRLYNECANHNIDFSIGSRYVGGKINVVNWDFKRLVLSFAASKYVRFITGIPIYDTTAGFVCYKADVLRKINLSTIKFVGYAFQVEMKYTAWKKGCTFKEVSIIFTDRKLGASKMNTSILSEGIFGVLKLKFRK